MRTLIYTIIFLIFSINLALSFQSSSDEKDIGTGGRDDLSYLNAKNSNFKKGNDALKQALKFEKKKKFKKANKKFEKALKYFVKAYKENPDNIEVIKYLAYTYGEVDDFMMAEIYYKEALSIEPKNIFVNKRLGELYINTKRINLAKERLEALRVCNCEEYLILKNILEKDY